MQGASSRCEVRSRISQVATMPSLIGMLTSMKIKGQVGECCPQRQLYAKSMRQWTISKACWPFMAFSTDRWYLWFKIVSIAIKLKTLSSTSRIIGESFMRHRVFDWAQRERFDDYLLLEGTRSSWSETFSPSQTCLVAPISTQILSRLAPSQLLLSSTLLVSLCIDIAPFIGEEEICKMGYALT